MNRVWKWILGILAVLVLLWLLVPIGYAWRSYSLGAFDAPWIDPNCYWMWHHPGRPSMWFGWGGYGMFPFGGFVWGWIGGLIRLLILAALLYGAYWLGQRSLRSQPNPVPAAPAPSASSAPTSPPAPTPEAAPAPPPADTSSQAT